MLLLKLSLLGLLIAAPGLVFPIENVITCYGHVQRLQCETGRIHVKSAVYGRTHSTTCIPGLLLSLYQNTNCAINIPQIVQRCEGLQVCEFKTDLLGSPDPCFGTLKYYNTTYECTDSFLSPGVSVTCELGYSTLDCGDDVIEIINANYGRTDSTTCSASLSLFTLNTNCYAPDTFSIVSAWCNGKNKCTVEASYTIFTDPCFGTYKYLKIVYSCVG